MSLAYLGSDGNGSALIDLAKQTRLSWAEQRWAALGWDQLDFTGLG